MKAIVYSDIHSLFRNWFELFKLGTKFLKSVLLVIKNI